MLETRDMTTRSATHWIALNYNVSIFSGFIVNHAIGTARQVQKSRICKTVSIGFSAMEKEHFSSGLLQSDQNVPIVDSTSVDLLILAFQSLMINL
jgi:hypothetical protein